MNILAINTAGETEILLLSGGKEYYYRNSNMRLTSEILLPEIERLLTESGLSISDVDYICPVIGPGSFTGVRIAVVTAKAFALAGKIKIAPVTFNEVVSYNYIPREGVLTVVDGSGGTCYYSRFTNGAMGEILCCKIDELKLKLASMSALIACDGESLKHFDGKACFDSSCLKMAAQNAVRENRFVDADSLEPLYIRKAQPERKAGDL